VITDDDGRRRSAAEGTGYVEAQGVWRGDPDASPAPTTPPLVAEEPFESVQLMVRGDRGRNPGGQLCLADRLSTCRNYRPWRTPTTRRDPAKIDQEDWVVNAKTLNHQ
jgi:hypothetical protein